MDTEYQVALQFNAPHLPNYNRLIELENLLLEELKALGSVDGHDFGSGQCNIFVITSNPQILCSALSESLLGQHDLHDFKIAYRPLSESKYTVFLPQNDITFVIL